MHACSGFGNPRIHKTQVSQKRFQIKPLRRSQDQSWCQKRNNFSKRFPIILIVDFHFLARLLKLKWLDVECIHILLTIRTYTTGRASLREGTAHVNQKIHFALFLFLFWHNRCALEKAQRMSLTRIISLVFFEAQQESSARHFEE